MALKRIKIVGAFSLCCLLLLSCGVKKVKIKGTKPQWSLVTSGESSDHKKMRSSKLFWKVKDGDQSFILYMRDIPDCDMVAPLSGSTEYKISGHLMKEVGKRYFNKRYSKEGRMEKIVTHGEKYYSIGENENFLVVKSISPSPCM